MENTLENKAKYLLHCYADNKNSIKSIQGSGVVFGILDIINNPEQFYAEAKPLHAISDEDAIEVARIIKFNISEKTTPTFKIALLCNIEEGSKLLNITLDKALVVYQCLQSKGYALPWNGLSVEELQSRGWLRLK